MVHRYGYVIFVDKETFEKGRRLTKEQNKILEEDIREALKERLRILIEVNQGERSL